MIINLPDIGFSSSQNIFAPDQHYTSLKESIVRTVSFQQQFLSKEHDREKLMTLKHMPSNPTMAIMRSSAISNHHVPPFQDYMKLHTRELYLTMRKLIMDQTYEFLNQKQAQSCSQDASIDFTLFSQWLNMYPFIRTIVRESLMPRVWSITENAAVPDRMILQPV